MHKPKYILTMFSYFYLLWNYIKPTIQQQKQQLKQKMAQCTLFLTSFYIYSSSNNISSGRDSRFTFWLLQ